ncbi:MAG TPA: hypothetical protein DEP32_13845 [Pseudomonas sp.]|nr:hypothetical protein [Pseudomonas sp.]MBB50270.1 hypothetical protein [Pseudomonadales bacterium]MBB50482.1 hypothetical protein [Pseudomonadales bacterium]HCA25243.1 hypothetical protein [Pseudomonas sp.]|tara:strand:+ start:12164 stop:12538 length:375 start_codon:yes stop_codon:yes gene_type:complete
MIRAIDEMLRLWAAELHPPGGTWRCESGGGGSPLAALIDSKGVMIRSTRGARVLLDESAEIELIVRKHLPFRESQVIWEHYTNYDSFEYQRLEACGCSRAQFYRRLHMAHCLIQQGLMNRKRAA